MIATLALPLLLALDSPSPQPATDPYAIYRAAMSHLTTLQQPKFLIDTEHWVEYTAGGGYSEWDEQRIFNSETRRECVLNVPFTPRPPQIGESYFAPDSWLINHQSASASSSDDNAHGLRPDLSDLRTIASVVSVAKPSYEIRLIGIDPLTHGGSAYHLSLRPRSNPMVHNLRELWINTQTDAIMRAVIEGYYRPNYTSMPAVTDVTEDFGQVGQYWLVIHHVWTYHSPFSSSTQYSATSLTMRFPDNLPDWLFDPQQFVKHFGDVDAALGT